MNTRSDGGVLNEHEWSSLVTGRDRFSLYIIEITIMNFNRRITVMNAITGIS